MMDSLFRFKKVIPVAVISCTQYNRFIVSPIRTYVFIYCLKEKHVISVCFEINICFRNNMSLRQIAAVSILF